MNAPLVHQFDSSLPEYLTWESDMDLPAEAYSLYLEWMVQRLRVWAHFGGPALLDQMKRLPHGARKRVITSPALYHLLRASLEPSPQVYATVCELLQAELDLHEGRTPRNWTALYDHYSPAGESSTETASTSGPCQLSTPYDAPVIDGIVIDNYSPAGPRALNKFGTIAPHSSEQLPQICGLVQETLDFVRAVNLRAYSLVKSSISVLAVGEDHSRPEMTGSASWALEIGVTGLINLMSGKWHVAKIANGLVHEAIHGLLYKIELAFPFYDPEAATQVKVVSPWSQRTLQLHSFVHACFVWYGLWNFWRLAPSIDQRDSLLEQAARGFVAPGPLGNVSSDVHASVHPMVRAAIEEMTRRVATTESLFAAGVPA